jgi:hypothetical protein
VVLEAGQRAPHPRLELALEQDVADHPSLAGDRVQGQKARAWQLVAALVAVEASEKLVAAADRESRRAVPDGLLQRRPQRRQRGGDQLLLAVPGRRPRRRDRGRPA